MKKYEDRSDGGICISDNQAQIYLAPNEAYALWQWLSARKDAFHTLVKSSWSWKFFFTKKT